MLQVGLPCTLDNGVAEVKAIAKAISGKSGGNGGVREIAEFILKAQGKWNQVVASFTASAGAGASSSGIKSPKCESSSSPIGVSNETGS